MQFVAVAQEKEVGNGGKRCKGHPIKSDPRRWLRPGGPWSLQQCNPCPRFVPCPIRLHVVSNHDAAAKKGTWSLASHRNPWSSMDSPRLTCSFPRQTEGRMTRAGVATGFLCVRVRDICRPSRDLTLVLVNLRLVPERRWLESVSRDSRKSSF
jgi:hypothetical protein